jgi:hypothetical protein
MKLLRAVARAWLALPLIYSVPSLAVDLLPMAKPSFDRAPSHELLRSLTVNQADGYRIGEIVMAKKGERLYRRTFMTASGVTSYQITADMEVEHTQGLFGNSTSSVVAGTYQATYKVEHPVYGELDYVPVKFKRGLQYALLFDQQGKLAPEMLRVNLMDDRLVSAEKVVSVSSVPVLVTRQDIVARNNSFDMIYAGIENGLLSIAVNCFDANGSLANKRTFQFPDDAKLIKVAGDELEVISSQPGALSLRPLTPPAVGICKML